MDKALHGAAVKDALATKGWTQKRLAEEIGVTSQAVTNWLKGVDFPRPAALLKLATALQLTFEQLVEVTATKPIVAFRKKAAAKTTDEHVTKALAMAAMLKPLVAYLPPRRSLRTQIPSPSTEYERLQNAAALVRNKLGVGMQAALPYQSLISEFCANDAVIIPVMWGRKNRHENALHILLPDEQVTFIYLNLDTHLEDFKFWMAHELAHVYTPDIAGTNDGEDFADALAGALLFPRELAQRAYTDAKRARSIHGETEALLRYAHSHDISLYSVFCETSHFARSMTLPPLRVASEDIHAVRNSNRRSTVSEAIFSPVPPSPSAYVAASKVTFQSQFFPALQKMLHESGTGPSYVQQVLDLSMIDASALHAELTS